MRRIQLLGTKRVIACRGWLRGIFLDCAAVAVILWIGVPGVVVNRPSPLFAGDDQAQPLPQRIVPDGARWADVQAIQERYAREFDALLGRLDPALARRAANFTDDTDSALKQEIVAAGFSNDVAPDVRAQRTADLLSRHPDPYEQGQILVQKARTDALAHRTEEATQTIHEALKLPLWPDQRPELYHIMGQFALTKFHQKNSQISFPDARREFATQYLRGVRTALDCPFPRNLPNLLCSNTLERVTLPDDPIERQATLAAIERRKVVEAKAMMLLGLLVRTEGLRAEMEGEVVAFYAMDPIDPGELTQLAADILQNTEEQARLLKALSARIGKPAHGEAAQGLTFSANPRTRQIVVAECEKEKRACIEAGQTSNGYFNHLCDAMATLDVIDSIGREGLAALYDGQEIRFNVYQRYIPKYMLSDPGPETKKGAQFDELLAIADSYAVQFNDPASIQKGLGLYHDVIQSFPNDPRRYEVELKIYDILRCQGSDESLGQAASLIRKLAEKVDVKDSVGQEILFRFVDFQLGEAGGHSFQDLSAAENAIGQLIRVTSKDEASIAHLRALEQQIRLQIVKGNEGVALEQAISVLQKSAERDSKGFAHDLWTNDRELYERYGVANEKIAEAAAWAISKSGDVSLIQRINQYPMLVSHYDILGDAVAEATVGGQRPADSTVNQEATPPAVPSQERETSATVKAPPQDTSFPLGHLAVKEVEGGQLQVEARCVETRLVLEEIAKHTGAPVVFDTPCRTYVSQLDPKRTTTPEKWMDFIAGSGGELSCRMEEGAWHVRQQSNPPYDAGLQEEEVKTLFTSNAASTPSDTGGTATGLVFIRGKMIPPPYQVTHELGADGRTLEVKINGVPFRHIRPEPSSNERPTAPSLPPDGQFTDFALLGDYVSDDLYPRLLQRATPKEAQAQVMQFLATQSIIEKAKLQESGQIVISVRRPGLIHALSVTVFPSNYNWATGEIISMRTKNGNVAPEEKAKEAQKMILVELARDSVLFYGRTVEVSFCHHPPIALFAGALEKSRGLPLFQAECLFAEVVEDRGLARELAANAANLDDAALSNVQAILSRKKVAELSPPAAPHLRYLLMVVGVLVVCAVVLCWRSAARRGRHA